MGIETRWTPIFEPEWREWYVVAPESGDLLVVPSESESFFSSESADGVGLSAPTRRDSLDVMFTRKDEVPRPAVAEPRLAWMLRWLIWKALQALPPLIGLGATVRLVERAAARKTTRESLEVVFARVKAVEGVQHAPLCLPRALARFGLSLIHI